MRVKSINTNHASVAGLGSIGLEDSLVGGSAPSRGKRRYPGQVVHWVETAGIGHRESLDPPGGFAATGYGAWKCLIFSRLRQRRVSMYHVLSNL